MVLPIRDIYSSYLIEFDVRFSDQSTKKLFLPAGERPTLTTAFEDGTVLEDVLDDVATMTFKSFKYPRTYTPEIASEYRPYIPEELIDWVEHSFLNVGLAKVIVDNLRTIISKNPYSQSYSRPYKWTPPDA